MARGPAPWTHELLAEEPLAQKLSGFGAYASQGILLGAVAPDDQPFSAGRQRHLVGSVLGTLALPSGGRVATAETRFPSDGAGLEHQRPPVEGVGTVLDSRHLAVLAVHEA